MLITISLSNQRTDEKPKKGSSIYSKLTFTRKTLSLSEFVKAISDGYMFCGVYDDITFPNNYKTSEHLINNNIVSIDVDNCYCTMRDFMSTLQYHPTIAYETFSNGEEGKGYRFRLLYVFNDFIDGVTYTRLYNAICLVNNMKCMEENDKSTSSPYQKIWGTNGKYRNIETTGYIWKIEDFKEFMTDDEVSSSNDLYIHTPQDNKRLVLDTYEFNDKDFENMWNTSVDIEILEHMRQYQTHESTYIEFKEGELWKDLDNTDYYQIKRKWETRLFFNGGRYKAIPVAKRLKNGEHRRYKIYMSLIRRRLIDPSITLEHLCYAALYELYFFMSNCKEDYITRQQLYKKACEALNADLDKYREKLKENKHFKVNKMEAARQGLTVRQAVAKANSERISKRKEQEYKELSKKYDPQLSVRKNAELLGVSKGTILNLKKWINEQ